MTSVQNIAKLLIATLLLASCAKQGMPSGGPKDVVPPRVVRCLPANEGLAFEGSQFAVEFDEYVVLKEVESNLIVSPPMEPKPEVKVKGRGIVVRLRDSLQANTTYSFQFLGAIADFNEGNLLPAFEYVFSTGQSIDSMMIKGTVQDALTLKPMEEPLTVLLTDDTLGVRYQTRSLKDGTFAFNHIAEGCYKLLAIKDENKNLRLDTTEACAWLDTLVEAHPMPKDSTLHSQLSTLNFSAPEREKQRVVSSEFLDKSRIRIITKRPMQEPGLQSDSTLLWQLGAKGDTLMVYTLHPADSMRIILTDASGLQDTLRLRFRPMPRPTPPGGTPKVKPNFSGQMPYFDTLRFTFQLPVSMPDTLLHYLSTDSTEEGYAPCLPIYNLKPITYNLSTALAVDWRPTPGKEYTLRLMGVDTSSFKLQITKPEDYGNIHLAAPEGWLYQLLDEKDNIMPGFSHLKPGKYRIRAIDDRDGNGRWTPGDYYLGRQPERVVYFPKTLEVRANWDMEETWNPDEQ